MNKQIRQRLAWVERTLSAVILVSSVGAAASLDPLYVSGPHDSCAGN